MWRSVEVGCPRCGARRSVELATSLNAGRTAWAHAAARDGALHRVDCGCGERLQLESDFSYLDVGRGHWLAVHEPWRQADGTVLEAQARRVFHEVTGRAEPVWVDHAVTLRLRVVFGLDALAEKLRVWEAGLDDRVVEVLKRELRRARPGLDAPLRVAAVEPERLVVVCGDAAVAADRARYRALAADVDVLAVKHRDLFGGIWVDADRQR